MWNLLKTEMFLPEKPYVDVFLSWIDFSRTFRTESCDISSDDDVFHWSKDQNTRYLVENEFGMKQRNVYDFWKLIQFTFIVQHHNTITSIKNYPLWPVGDETQETKYNAFWVQKFNERNNKIGR